MIRPLERQYANIRTARNHAAEAVSQAIRDSHYSDADKGTMYRIIDVTEPAAAYRIYRNADTIVREVFQNLIESVCREPSDDDAHAEGLKTQGSYMTPTRQVANTRVIRSYAPYRAADAVRRSRYSDAAKKAMLNILNMEKDEDAVWEYWKADDDVRNALQDIIGETLRHMRRDTLMDTDPAAKPTEKTKNEKQLVIIMNGIGRAGKDTLCRYVTDAKGPDKVWNFSSIDPVLVPAMVAGWDGRKTPEGRKLLSEFKNEMIQYGNEPVRYLLGKYREFAASNAEILFVHIREPEEIDKFKANLPKDARCTTILVTGKEIGRTWGNRADDGVGNYRYDHVFLNNDTKDVSGKAFVKLVRSILDGTDKQSNEYTKTLIVDKSAAAYIKRSLDWKDGDPEDFHLGEMESITQTVDFDDGRQMDIKCCGTRSGEGSAWTEAVLFSENGAQLAVSECSDKFFCEWELCYNGVSYCVNVVEEA